MIKLKKALSILCLFVFTCATCFILSSCGLFDTSEKKLATRTVVAVGNTVYWSKIADDTATDYDVYKNNEFYLNTKQLYIIENDLTQNAQYYVIAKDSTGEKKNSDKSETVMLYQNTGFEESKCMEIELENEMGYSIPSTISYVKVTGKGENTFIQIMNRTSDLVLELNEVTLISSMGKNCIDAPIDNNSSFTVMVVLNGSSEITGGDYTDVPKKPSENSGRTGTTGGKGGSGIVAPRVAFAGSGSLVINGGNGGKGGDGADSSGFSTAVYGNGGQGGEGGDGVVCNLAVMSMDMAGYVKIITGAGGQGGTPGANGSIITGPANTADYKRRYGKEGDKGKAINGAYRTYSGVFIK